MYMSCVFYLLFTADSSWLPHWQKHPVPVQHASWDTQHLPGVKHSELWHGRWVSLGSLNVAPQACAQSNSASRCVSMEYTSTIWVVGPSPHILRAISHYQVKIYFGIFFRSTFKEQPGAVTYICNSVAWFRRRLKQFEMVLETSKSALNWSEILQLFGKIIGKINTMQNKVVYQDIIKNTCKVWSENHAKPQPRATVAGGKGICFCRICPGNMVWETAWVGHRIPEASC